MLLPQPLTPGRLLKRYKRFLSDIELESGRVVTAHCANPGAMTGLDAPGLPVWLSHSDDPGRKLEWSLELVELPTGLVGINTSHPNRIVAEALKSGTIPPFADYPVIRPEVRYAERSRVDFLLSGPGLSDLYLEVKNVHLCRQAGLAEFPDCPTARGTRHLFDLAAMTEAGHRAAMLYLVQRTDCDRFTLASDIDPAYAKAFASACETGVEAYCYACTVTREEIRLSQALPFAQL
jgi:sugar fermentation stimulation protein A